MEMLLALMYASTIPIRVTLAVSSTLWAISLPFTTEMMFRTSPRLHLMAEIMPLDVWAGVFGLLSFCLWWRLLDPVPRIAWARIINSFSFGLWFSLTVTAFMRIDGMFPPASSDTALAVMSLWVALRTEVRPRDRETA